MIRKAENHDQIRVLGLMSGTSLDGLDLALCCFAKKDGKWAYSIEKCAFVPYKNHWLKKLTQAYITPISKLTQLHVEYGNWLGQQVNEFLSGLQPPNLIASHGHTVHHDPASGITFQLGHGQAIADITEIDTIYDFRSKDVSLGGQGAPLVPVGDRLLFPEYDACLNLGGFSNISFEKNGLRSAFDICPVNILLNPLAIKLGSAFDESGKLARTGKVDAELLKKLLDINSPQSLQVSDKTELKTRPSLSREWVEKNIDPLLSKANIPVQDKLRTLVEYMAYEMSLVLHSQHIKTVLVTGGGAYNSFLMELLSEFSGIKIVLPEKQLIDFKEALIFAFLGTLRYYNEINVLCSVTGASEDSVSGVLLKTKAQGVSHLFNA